MGPGKEKWDDPGSPIVSDVPAVLEAARDSQNRSLWLHMRLRARSAQLDCEVEGDVGGLESEG